MFGKGLAGKNLIKSLGFIVIIYGIYYVFNNVLLQPWYILVLVYAAVTALFVFIYRARFLIIVANICLKAGYHDTASKLIKKAYYSDQNNVLACAYYGVFLNRAGNGKEAVPILQKALTKKPDIMTERYIYLALGSAYWVIGDLDSAIDTLEGMKKRYEYVSPSVYSTLGFIYLLRNDFDKALENTDLAKEKDDNMSTVWDNYGQIYYRQEKYEEAKENFKKAIEANDSYVDSLYYLGMIAEKEGLEEEAKEYFNKAVSLKVNHLNTVSDEQLEEKKVQYNL